MVLTNIFCLRIIVGENILALLRKLSSSPQLANPGHEKHGTMIYFDLVGLIMIYYPQSVAVFINSALIAAIVFRILRRTFSVIASGMGFRLECYEQELFPVFVVQYLSVNNSKYYTIKRPMLR